MLAAFFRETPELFSDAPHRTTVFWDSLVQEAATEALFPTLSARVRTLGIRELLPADVVSLFAATELLNEERNKTVLSEAVHVTRLLNQIGIQPVALKGLAYLFAEVYPNLGYRFLADIDLLVPAHQVARAASHLAQNDYYEDDSDALGHFRHHYPALRRDGFPFIELHTLVGLGVCDRILPAAEIFAQAKLVTIDGAQILIPSPTHMVSHLILHSQLAHPYSERIFPSIRSLHDLSQLHSHFGALVDWPQIENSYRGAGEYATLALHLLQARQVIGVKIPGLTSGTIQLTFLEKLRWYRRKVLNRHPWVRFLDPSYLLLSLVSRRLRVLSRLLAEPKSWFLIARRLTKSSFYKKLFDF